MTRLLVICEGRTEADFVEKIIAPILWEESIYADACLLGSSRPKSGSGGDVSFARLRVDVSISLKRDPGKYVTTFVDFYGLKNDIPGLEKAKAQKNPEQKLEILKSSVIEDLSQDLDHQHLTRFIPYFQMHELEGLLFSNPEKLALAMDKKAIVDDLRAISGLFETPEHINDDYETCPSRRLLNAHRAYDKRTHGILAAQAIGLDEIRRKCPLFNAWLVQLLSLPAL